MGYANNINVTVKTDILIITVLLV